MARKLSRVAFSLIGTIAAAAALLPAASAAAQSGVQGTSTPKQVINPFAARRQAANSDEAETEPPVAVPPAQSGGPKTYQNPFAARRSEPRFVTPRLRPGPLSRWHRSAGPPPPQDDERPIRDPASGAPGGRRSFGAVGTADGSREACGAVRSAWRGPPSSRFGRRQALNPARSSPLRLDSTCPTDLVVARQNEPGGKERAGRGGGRHRCKQWLKRRGTHSKRATAKK